MITAWQVRAVGHRARLAGEVYAVARATQIAGQDVNIEGWVRDQADRLADANRQALLLAEAARSLSDAGRVPGALMLGEQALLTSRFAGKATLLEVVGAIAPVLAAAGMREELAAITGVLEELRDWSKSASAPETES